MQITIKMLIGWLLAAVIFLALALSSNNRVDETALTDWVANEIASQAAADLLADDRVRLKYLVEGLASSDAVSYAAILDADMAAVVSSGDRSIDANEISKPVLIDRALAGYAVVHVVSTPVSGPGAWWFLIPLIVLAVTPLFASNQVVIQGARPIKGTTYQLKVQLGSALDTPHANTQIVQHIDQIYSLVSQLYPLKPEGHGLTFVNTSDTLFQCLCCSVVVRNALASILDSQQLDQIRVVMGPASVQIKASHPITLHGFMPALDSNSQWQIIPMGESFIASLADEQLEGLLERQASMIAKQIKS